MNSKSTAAILMITSVLGCTYMVLKTQAQVPHSKSIRKNDSNIHQSPISDIRKSSNWYQLKEAFKKNEWYLRNGMISTSDYHSNNAHIYMLMGELDFAYNEIQSAIADSPISSDAYGMLAIYHASIGNFPQSFIASDRSIALAPETGIPYLNRSVIYSVIEDREQFLACYNLAIKIERQHRRIVSRVPMEMVLLVDHPDQSYKYAMLDIKDRGIKDLYSQRSIILAILSLRYLNRHKEADRILHDCLKWLTPQKYQFYYAFKYMNGEITSQNLIDESRKQDIYKQKWYEMHSRIWIGVDLDQKGDVHESQKHLNWVIMNQKSATTACFVQGIAKPLIRKQNLRLMNQHNAPKL